MAGDVTKTGRWSEVDVFRAPVGTAAPVDTTTALAVAWTALGFMDGEAGIVRAMDESSDNLRVWGGTIVDSTSEFNGQTFQFTAAEDNAVVFGLIYEGSAAPVTATGTETRVAKIPSRGEHAFVIELRKPGKTKRIVIPRAKVAEVGDRTEAETELPTVELTINVLAASDRTMFTELLSA